MENFITIQADSRTDTGKKYAKQIRKQGRVPAIIYGEHKESLPLTLAYSDLKTILKSDMGENTVLKIQNNNSDMWAMMKELQYDHLGDTVIHVDLLRIDLSKEVIVHVPIRINGEPIGVKIEGGFFDFMTRDVRVKCIATRIPKEFVIDVADMHTGQTIKAADIPTGDAVKIVSDSHTVICSCSARGGAETDEKSSKPEA